MPHLLCCHWDGTLQATLYRFNPWRLPTDACTYTHRDTGCLSIKGWQEISTIIWAIQASIDRARERISNGRWLMYDVNLSFNSH